MKMIVCLFAPVPRVGALLLFGAALLRAAAPAAPAPAVAAPAARSAQPKPYAIFMGLDFSIERNKQLHRVRSVERDAYVIQVDGRDVALTPGDQALTLKIEPSLKLTDLAATVTNLKGEPAYTPANDPHRKFLREQPGLAGSASAALAMGAYNAAQTQMAGAGAAMNAGADPSASAGMAAAAQANIGAALTMANNANFAANSDFNNVGLYAARMQAELDQKLFDAMEISFEVSSPTPLSRPYVVVFTTYRERGAKDSAVQNRIYAKELAPIGAKPAKVRLLQGGLPPGFELQSYQVHLYNNGAEIATDVAPKRVPLSRDDAFQFVLMEYLSTHKGATVPAAPTMVKLPPEVRSRLEAGQYTGTYYVKVGKDGLPGEAFADAGCSQPVADEYVRNLVKDLRFRPALEKGRPVESILPLSLGSLLRG
jgi:hypothetical protein